MFKLTVMSGTSFLFLIRLDFYFLSPEAFPPTLFKSSKASDVLDLFLPLFIFLPHDHLLFVTSGFFGKEGSYMPLHVMEGHSS